MTQEKEPLKQEVKIESKNIKADMIRLLQQEDVEAVSLVAKNGQHTLVLIHEKLKPYEKVVRILATITDIFSMND